MEQKPHTDPSAVAGNLVQNDEILRLQGAARNLDYTGDEARVLASALSAEGTNLNLDPATINSNNLIALGGNKQRSLVDINLQDSNSDYFLVTMMDENKAAHVVQITPELLSGKTQGEAFRIGRSDEADVPIWDTMVSREDHAFVAHSSEGHIAVGSASTIPTYLLERPRTTQPEPEIDMTIESPFVDEPIKELPELVEIAAASEPQAPEPIEQVVEAVPEAAAVQEVEPAEELPELAKVEVAVDNQPEELEVKEEIAVTESEVIAEQQVDPEVMVGQEFEPETELNRNQKAAMDELYDGWKLPEEATPEDAVRKLDSTLESLQLLAVRTGHESPAAVALADMKNRLQMTLNDSMPHFNPEHVQMAFDAIVQIRSELMQMVHGDVLLPMRTKSQLDGELSNISHFANVLEQITPRGGMVNLQDVEMAWHLSMRDPVENMRQEILRAQKQVEEKRIDLMGYSAATAEKETAKVEFADDRINEMAKTLRAEGVSDKEVESARIAMERIIDDTIAVANAKGEQFPQQVQDDTKKNVNSPESTLNGQNINSRKYVANLAVDLLRGKFDFDSASDPIVLAKDGSVEVSHHRAAALMTMYGKNWVKKAEELGLKVTRR